MCDSGKLPEKCKFLCVVMQVMQSVNCPAARRLKNMLVDQTWDAVVH